MLEPGGALSRVLPGYEPRRPQLQMMRLVEEALRVGRALVVEAGTGTGKTLAYLLPAADADVIVVNHHLFFADLALRSSSAGDAGAAVLPRYDAVIFDEAHAVEEVATEHFGAQLSSFRVSELARDATKVLAQRPQMIEAAGAAMRLLREGRDFFDAAMQTGPGGDRWAILPGALKPAEPQRKQLAELVRSLGAALSQVKDDELDLLEYRCLSLGADLELFAGAESPDLIHWAESRGGHLF